MSDLRFTTLADTAGSNTSTTSQIHEGVAKAWVYFTNTSGSPSIQNSFNVNSITDLNTGTYVVNYATSLGTTLVNLCNCADATTTDQHAAPGNVTKPFNQTATSCTMYTGNFSVTYQDKDFNFYVCHG